jgi:hypothetical protein
MEEIEFKKGYIYKYYDYGREHKVIIYIESISKDTKQKYPVKTIEITPDVCDENYWDEIVYSNNLKEIGPIEDYPEYVI